MAILSFLLLVNNPAWAKKRKHPRPKHKEPPVQESYAGRPEVDAFSRELAQQGLDAAFVTATLQQARKLESVRNAVRPLPAGVKKNWQAYRAHFLDPEHIQAGVRFAAENQAALARATSLYGVPESVILGILGVETLYGSNTGNYRVIDSLATLAFDYPKAAKDRSSYFRGQLAEFFKWCARSQCEPLGVVGSYAGAIGMPQFMPENIERFGVDFDGDGQINLQTPADAIGSVARFLALHGWTPNLPACYAVDVGGAELAPLLEPDIIPTFAYWQLQAFGAKPLDPLPPWEKFALVDLQNGDDPSDYLIGSRNFFVLTRYNRSAYYAMAVLELGQAIEEARKQALTTGTTTGDIQAPISGN
jgi:membrane-bound lytic murein transglycosylase B